MKAIKLHGLEPQSVFAYFEKICSIPHGSGNTKAISDYLVSFAKEHHLRYTQDALNNVILFADGTKGYENHEPIILQGHMDMVCEKDESSPIDMQKDGLDITHNDKVVYANGTTLGGDDGIAVAFMLAILDDETIPHPPLEMVITVEEEVGMEGASGIDLSSLKGRKLINIDSEDEGVFTVSCAGGAKSTIHFPLEECSVKGEAITLSISDLIGGHSGTEIHKNHANANKVMGEWLYRIQKEFGDFYLIDIAGGAKDNAIPRTATAKIMTDISIEKIDEVGKNLLAEVQKNYDEPNVQCTVALEDKAYKNAISTTCTKRLISLLNTVPNGIQSWSKDMKGLVQTSLNLGIVKMENKELHLTFAVRSSKKAEKEELLEKLKTIAKEYSASYTQRGDYPAWEYKKDSVLRDTLVSVYQEMYHEEPKIEAIHAGLECGLLSEKLPNLDCISIGPQLHDVHTSRETLEIASTKRTYEFLLAILKAL